MIKYKAEGYSKVVQVNKFFPSSKLCNHCGYKKEDLYLNVRNWTCPSCGHFHDRDFIAAFNILIEATRLNNEKCIVGTTGIKACASMNHEVHLSENLHSPIGWRSSILQIVWS